MGQRSLALQELRTAAELNAELRELKARSRLTYRQLEEHAARQGELLPRSTLADVLRNGSLPRPELLAAFVRACGEGEDVDEWLAARQRAAEAQEPPPDGDPAPEKAPGPVRWLMGARRTRVVAVSVTAAVALITTASWALRDSGDSGTPDDRTSAEPTAEAAQLPHDPVLIRPLGSPGLCVTDGKVADGRYDSLVAVQRPCDETAPQTTTLDPLGQGAHHISWYRPGQGKGCLKELTSGPGKGLLEPWDNCDPTTAFRFVPTKPEKPKKTGKAAVRTYLIHVTDERCVGIKDASSAAGAEAVVEPCTGTDAQLFVVEAAL
ncbi:XRE family transcriptional regulator [Streptomyces yaanensis]|uniref:XRE family transcriptional regulator n=1 Tax=Streptomyces yaanensis TaxID=1142239 RepID=A0ABV7S9Z2_9ACTN|nr:helix-turn-helix transcriptional regulator [Streptomyces sp. CGMCC 4.7035]WNC02601.1 helix-turn-helix transcriptional regulator [Streptomyces sp. CGMCC 4.7035]